MTRTKKPDKEWGRRVRSTQPAIGIGFDFGTEGILLRRRNSLVWVVPAGRVGAGVFAAEFWK